MTATHGCFHRPLPKKKTGQPDGAACLASEWGDDYFATIKSFIEKTGFDVITTDGPFEGAKCYSANHTHHLGVNDSQWTQCVSKGSALVAGEGGDTTTKWASRMILIASPRTRLTGRTRDKATENDLADA